HRAGECAAAACPALSRPASLQYPPAEYRHGCGDAGAGGRAVRVLIVDDEHLARQAMRRLLAGHSEIEIVGEAESLSEAAASIERTEPELVFLDIELGGGDDGFDLLATLKR